MKSNYPIVLNVIGKKAIVIGGGTVAERKIIKLKEAGAHVTVVSPKVTGFLKDWIINKEIEWVKKTFETADVKHAFIVVAATNDNEVNFQVFQSTHKNQLINIIDDPYHSNFIVPSTLYRGKLTISISTSGASPALSRKIKNELSDKYDDCYEEYLDFLFECRLKIQEEIDDTVQKRKIFKALLNEEFLEMTRKSKYELREERFLALWKGVNKLP
ncbi:precorrin-2 dehydrogenase / sirohydrochlorin ferrochelatase [Thalassobacillus cyri]|uniref:precorrin-2 dehydrogenase n=1 Tax=Thalassobacillus cyri TaxID=571932 RepID=A0A1H4GW22_9BACI|nr:NAD(P)-binding protein [Thalassobacillus cyri]SEB13747.1 precorrin-2 dehydrogenase / sirohydrochlorin ferrochelatase [Thalassobacillus cyri]